MTNKTQRNWKWVVATAFTVATLASTGISVAQEGNKYYEGKTISLYIGYSAGGGYDTYARMLGKYMSQHIPGNPNIIPRQMTGGGSRTAATFMANIAPKDGTAIAVTDQSLPLFQTLGDSSIQFDTTAFRYIGNPIADNNLVATWHTSKVKTFEDAQNTSVTIGASGPDTSAFYPTAMNEILGTKFKLVMGYGGGSKINLAMQQGEVEGRGGNSWSSYKATTPFVKNNELNYIVQVGIKRAKDLPDVPLLHELAKNKADEAALRLLSAPTAIGRPFYTAPGTPDKVVQILRDAFDKTMSDPEFLAATQKGGLDINPVSGKEVQSIVNGIVNATPEAIDRLHDALEPLLPN